MPGKYYTLQEVMEKLGKSEDQVKDLVKEGTLRQYLDKGQPLFDQTQVDGLSADQQGLLDLTAAGTDFDLQLEETSEIKLEPDETSQASPKEGKEDSESEGGFGLSMAGGDLTSADTRASSFGINVLDETDEGYKLAADTKGETSAGELEEIESLDADANLESVGSGSGLLDLSLQADDTSLGAVLDDILPTGEAGGVGEAPSLEEPGGLLDEMPMAEESAEIEEEPLTAPSAEIPLSAESESMTVPVPSGPAAQLVAMAPVDPATTAYGLAMLIPFAALIIAAIALGAGLRQISPGLLNLIAGSRFVGVGISWWIAGGLFVLMLIVLAIFGAMFGEKKAASADIYQKPKKEKKAKKPKKEKKPKK